IRQAIESARATLGETRRTRVGSSRRGEDLVVLLESAELLFETLVAAGDQVEATARAASSAPTVTTALVAVEAPNVAPNAAPNAASGEALLAALRAAVDAVADVLAALGQSIPVPSRWRTEPTPEGHEADRAVLAFAESAEREPDPASPRAVAARGAA